MKKLLINLNIALLAWDSTYRVMITRVLATPDDYSYWRLMQKFCATLHDGHPNVWMPGPIAYLALNSFGDDKIDSIFIARLPELYKARALIVDLRNNGGGSTGIGFDILKYLTTDTIFPHSRYYTREHRAVFKAWGAYLKPADTLVNEVAASTQKHFTYIGDRSFGSTGQPYLFDLPGGARPVSVPRRLEKSLEVLRRQLKNQLQ